MNIANIDINDFLCGNCAVCPYRCKCKEYGEYKEFIQELREEQHERA